MITNTEKKAGIQSLKRTSKIMILLSFSSLFVPFAFSADFWSSRCRYCYTGGAPPCSGTVKLPAHGAIDGEEGTRVNGVRPGLFYDGDPDALPRGRGGVHLLQAAAGGASVCNVAFFLGLG